MLIYVKSWKKIKNKFLIYVNLCKYHRQTDGQTHQKYSSEPHKIQKKKTFHGQTDGRTAQNYSSEPHNNKMKKKEKV